MHTSPAGPSSERWLAIVHAVHADIECLVQEFVDLVMEIPPYSHGLVGRDRVEVDAVASFDYLLRRIGDSSVPARIADIGSTIGRNRARHGVPLSELLRAVSLDFQVLWGNMRKRADEEDMEILVDHVESVWSAVEDYSAAIQFSYLDEAAQLARERRRERTALVGMFLADSEPTTADVRRVALALDVDCTANFLVAAATPDSEHGLRTWVHQLSSAGRQVHIQETARHAIMIARWYGGEVLTHNSLTADGARCGVAPIARGLGQVPRMAEIAMEIADVYPTTQSQPLTIVDAWLMLTRARLGPLAEHIVDQVLRGLDEAHPAERQRLVQVAQTYLRSGSVQQTASELYCHRNTVINRLRRFADLTGHNLSVPTDAAAVVAALTWAGPETDGSSRPTAR